MADNRIKDAPPEFTISARTGNFKYHALLTETVWVPSTYVFDVRDEDGPTRKVNGETSIRVPIGLYGFPRVEDRQKFVRRCNTEADADEHKICFAVTLTLASMANAQVLITGPVAEDTTQE
jgi:hypothetical protein